MGRLIFATIGILLNNDIEGIKSNLAKNRYSLSLINKFMKKYLNNKILTNLNQSKHTSDVKYFKLLCIGKISNDIKMKHLKLSKQSRKEKLNFKLVLASFKIRNYFSYEDPIPEDLKYFLL